MLTKPASGLRRGFGSAIHNLRSALDLLASELVRLNGQSEKDVYFPFGKDPTHFEGQIKKRNFDRAAPDVVDLLRTLKPFDGGNAALRAIHDLDITDKHKALIPVADMIGMPNFSVSGPGGSFAMQDCKVGPVTDGQVLISVPLGTRGIEVGRELPGAFHLVFPMGEPLAKAEVIPALHSLHDLTLSIVKSFEVLVTSRPNPAPWA